MDIKELENFIQEIYSELKNDSRGKVADYIPELSKVNPDLFSISVCTNDGEIFNVGDHEVDFCLQSTSKIYSYCIAREKLGQKRVHSHVGYEPSGRAFNAFVLNKQGLPHNPLINAGAIMVASLLEPDKEPSERFNLVKNSLEEIAGHIGKIGFDNSVFLSEKQHADRNTSLAYYMRENGAFKKAISPNEISENLDLYFQCCSILINTKIGSVMAATLSNGGICPITKKKLFSNDTVKDCLTLMYGCGMYDFSGQFSFEIGLPAKSGVSGCIMLVIPNKMGICIWSPRLDEQGNSVRGIEICRKITQRYNFHIFNNMVCKQNIDVKLPESVLIQQAIGAASLGDLETIKQLENTISLNSADYDKRTPLHLAASEGHINVVKYLLAKNVNANCKDRWGNTPLSEIEAKQGENYEKIRNILKQYLSEIDD